MKSQSSSCAHASRGMPIETLNLTPVEFITLSIVRHYCGSFAHPESQGWMGAISDALACFGPEKGPHVSIAVLSVVQAMRRSRQSVFRFNSARCGHCSAYVSDHERTVINTLRAVVKGRPAAAASYAVILCEGNDHTAFLKALEVLVEVCELAPAEQDTFREKSPEPDVVVPSSARP